MDDDDQHRSDDRSISRLIEKREKYDIEGSEQKIGANRTCQMQKWTMTMHSHRPLLLMAILTSCQQ